MYQSVKEFPENTVQLMRVGNSSIDLLCYIESILIRNDIEFGLKLRDDKQEAFIWVYKRDQKFAKALIQKIMHRINYSELHEMTRIIYSFDN